MTTMLMATRQRTLMDMSALVMRGCCGPQAEAADQGVLRQELALPRTGLPDRGYTARGRDRSQAHRPLPRPGEVRPEGLPGGHGAIRQDHEVRASDRPPRARPGCEGRPAGEEPRRLFYPADSRRGQVTRPAPVVGSRAARIPRLGSGEGIPLPRVDPA